MSIQRKYYPLFMRMAFDVAKESDYPGGGNGAVLVSPDRKKICYGYTGLPSGDERSYDDVEDCDVLHAEENALHNAETSVVGWFIFCTKAPCRHCASLIIQRGLFAVVCTPQPKTSRWFKSCDYARQRLQHMRIAYLPYSLELPE